MLSFRGPLSQKMIHLRGIRFVLLCIKINLQPSRVNGKTVQREKKTLRRQRKTERKKIPDKGRKRELSPQLSVHQEVAPREAVLTGLIREAGQEVPQKDRK